MKFCVLLLSTMQSSSFQKFIPFQNFREEQCLFKGSTLAYLKEIKDEATCQLACQHIPLCKHYLYISTIKGEKGKFLKVSFHFTIAK